MGVQNYQVSCFRGAERNFSDVLTDVEKCAYAQELTLSPFSAVQCRISFTSSDKRGSLLLIVLQSRCWDEALKI